MITCHIQDQMKRCHTTSEQPGITELIPVLPNEVSVLILQQIPPKSLMWTASVNRIWRRVSLGLVTELDRVPYFTPHLLLPQMPNLQKIRLRENDFIPKSVTQSLTSLTNLTAFGPHHLDDATLASLTNLKTLVMKQCVNVTGKSLESLKKLSFLVMDEMHVLEFSCDAYLPNLKTLIVIDTFILPSVVNRLQVIAPKIKTLREQQAYGSRVIFYS